MARQLFRAGAITVAKEAAAIRGSGLKGEPSLIQRVVCMGNSPVMVKERISRAEGLVVKFGAAGFTSS